MLKGAETYVQDAFPQLRDRASIPNLPEELIFLHAEEILDMYPDLPRKPRETAILQEYPAVFIYRHRLDPRGRLSARDAGRRLRRLGHADGLGRRPADARPERRHPGLEPGDQAPPRAVLDGHPRDRRDAARSSSR